MCTISAIVLLFNSVLSMIKLLGVCYAYVRKSAAEVQVQSL